ncbi:MAG: methylmalonyl-CoA mutase family protein [Bacteroidales bacterium]
MENKKQKNLFSEFPPITTGQWEEVILKDLKGADYEKKLIKKTPDGIKIKPYYRSEDLKNLGHLLNSEPGSFPYVRGTRNDNNWLIRQDIIVNDISEANSGALDAIAKGAESISFVIKSLPAFTGKELEMLLKNFPFESVELNISAGKHTKSIISLLPEYLDKISFPKNKVKGSFDYDPLGFLTIYGYFGDDDLSGIIPFSKEMYKEAVESLPGIEFLTIHGNYFKNSGSTLVQELAFALSMAADYLSFASEAGIPVHEMAGKMRFKFAVGPDYFPEIAKIRAARYIWSKIIETFDASAVDGARMKIHSVTSEFNQTVYDHYVNMLRTTTEAMSAILGGTDSLSVVPFNLQFEETSAFSERIARNQQIILKKESYLDKVTDPSAGSYFIENLTNSIIDETWNLFLKLEEMGGYFKSLEKGFIQELIKESAQKRFDNIANRRDILLGTNQFANTKENALEYYKLNPKKPGKGFSVRPRIVEPIVLMRAAEDFENLRLATEKAQKRPGVFLFTYGNLAMRKARAGFALNFFACAGFEITDNPGFNTIAEGIEAAVKSTNEIVVICSADEEYPIISKEITDGLKNKIIVIAGYPKDSIEQLQAYGIKHFIHIKSNVLETLKSFQSELGIA